MEPKISIIIPVYNKEKYLRKCIDSIVSQTYEDIELVIVNDGSTDNSLKICTEYARKDKRIVLINKENGGLVSARKAGAKVARGEYITSVDADDWIEKHRLEDIVNSGLKNMPDILWLSGYCQVYEDYELVVEGNIPTGDYNNYEILGQFMNIDECFQMNAIPSHVCLVEKRDFHKFVLDKIDDGIERNEDTIFGWISLLNAKTIRFINQTGYYYRQISNSMAHNKSGNELYSINKVYEVIKNSIKKDIYEYEKIYKVFAFTMTRALMSIEGSKIFFQPNLCYLYPYSRIKKTSRIVVYGAGLMGRNLVRSILASDDYSVVCWVDKYPKGQKEDIVEVEKIDKLLEVEYDYIAVAVVESKVAKIIQTDLINLGVQKEKIALMDPAVISLECVENALYNMRDTN